MRLNPVREGCAPVPVTESVRVQPLTLAGRGRYVAVSARTELKGPPDAEPVHFMDPRCSLMDGVGKAFGRVLFLPLAVVFVLGAVLLGIGMVAWTLVKRPKASALVPGGCLRCLHNHKAHERCRVD